MPPPRHLNQTGVDATPRPGQDHLGKGLSGRDRQILIRRPGQLSWGPSWGAARLGHMLPGRPQYRACY